MATRITQIVGNDVSLSESAADIRRAHPVREFRVPSGNLANRTQPQLRSHLYRSLRATTRSDQVIIDRMLHRIDLSRREDYGLLLHAHHLTLRDLSPGWREEDRQDCSEMARRLQEDLRAVGFAAANFPANTWVPMTAGNSFGLAYVIRGSRLSMTHLRDRVPRHFAASYLEFSPALVWPRFLRQLERYVFEESEYARTAQVISGAKWASAQFAAHLTKAFL